MTSKAEETLQDLHEARLELMLTEHALQRAVAGLSQEKNRAEFNFHLGKATEVMRRIAERIGKKP